MVAIASKYVTCRVCGDKVGRRGIAQHSKKHKRQFLDAKGVEKDWFATDYDYEDVVAFFNPSETRRSRDDSDEGRQEIGLEKFLDFSKGGGSVASC